MKDKSSAGKFLFQGGPWGHQECRYLAAASKCCTRAKNAIRERHASMRVISSIFGAWECFNPDFGQKSFEKHFEWNSYFRSVCKCIGHLSFEAESSGIESLFQKILGNDSQADFGKKSAKYGEGVGVGGWVADSSGISRTWSGFFRNKDILLEFLQEITPRVKDSFCNQ